LPCRILISTQADSGEILQGGNITGRWNITDLFLCETVARDAGPYIITPVLKRYEVAWIEAVATLWNIKHGYSSSTLSLTYTALTGKYEYPSQSGVWFYGVKCDLTLEEIF